MPSKRDVNKFIKAQKSIQGYKKVQTAFREVLLSMSNKDFKKVTKNLILMVLHEGALGQVMHFSKIKGKFKILQLTFPKKIPISVLKFVIAHELGHVLQERNWKKGYGMKLEKETDERAESLGFTKTKTIAKWMKNHGEKLGF